MRTEIAALLSATWLSACAVTPRYDTAFVTLQTGSNSASQSAEIAGIIATAQARSVFCLKPSVSNPPDSTCPTNGASDPSGNDFHWGRGSVVSGTTALAFPLVAPLAIDPSENLTITFRPGAGGSKGWSIQSVVLQLQDSAGVLSPATVVRVSAPWTGADDCIARLSGSPNATQVQFTWANMISNDALTQSPGGILVDGNQAGRSSACAP
jgi:hypothetical protein